MIFNRYFLHVLLFIFWVANGQVSAGTGELTYEKFFRLNNPPVRSDSGDWLGLGYETDLPEEKLDTFFMGDVRFYFQDNNSLNYSMQEAYVRYKNSDYQFTVGRQILDWNVNEKYWSLGYLNAVQAFTLLSTEEEGVTAIVYKKYWNNFEFDILLSYLFIPQINPEIDFKNGEVESKSEWVRLPPRRTVVSGTPVSIFYKMSDYSVSNIVFNKSLGANIRYKWEEGGLSAFAVYKPENKLRINASAFYDVPLNKVVVEADPTVNHHAYYGLQLFHSFGDVHARGGLSYIDPNAKLGKDFPIDITNARRTFTSEFFTINPRYDKEAYTHMSLNLDRKKYALSLNYIHLLSKNIRGSDDFFSDTVKWKSTFGGSILYFFNDYFNILMDLKYDVVRKDNILKSEIKYNFRNRVNLALGLEVLKAPEDTSYWSYYRASDTLYSAIGIVF